MQRLKTDESCGCDLRWGGMPDQDPAGKPGCDFMGVNHYARGVVGFFLNPTNKGPKGIADMGCEPLPPPPT